MRRSCFETLITGLDLKTVERYLSVLRKSFHIDYLPPFHKNIASELRKMPKVYFNDLGFRNYLVGDFSAIGLRSDRGGLLVSYAYLVLRQAYTSDNIRYWRTQKKHEVDFIVKDFYQNQPLPPSLSSAVFTITAQPSRSPSSVYISFTSDAPTG